MKTIYLTAIDPNGRKVYLMAIKPHQTSNVFNIMLNNNESPSTAFFEYFNCFVDSEKFKYKSEGNLEIFEYNLGKLSKEEMSMHLIRAAKSQMFLKGYITGFAWLS
jgi:hypothetical protein